VSCPGGRAGRLMTGFTRAARQVLIDRSGGMCEICGMAPPADAHHRRPRSAGGTRRADANLPSNGLMLCRDCHSLVESRREFALDRGWLVRQGQSPADVPLVYQGNWALLGDDGFVFRPVSGRGRCERCGFHVEKQKHREGCQVG
jgi:5-methylcytosine-specific restriction protein A